MKNTFSTPNKDKELAIKIAKEVSKLNGHTYYVGGYCRDKCLGTVNKDIDIEVYGVTADQLRNILDKFGERLEHGKSFGVFGIKGFDIDIALPRTERCIGTSHTDFDVNVNPFMSTYEGALRRDLTMNALMIDVLTDEWVDHFGGINDIKNGIIRHVNTETFKEDPLRVLRVAQFAARFNMSVASETQKLCATMDITTLSKERIFIEVKKALEKSETPSIFFNVLRDMGHLIEWFPELQQLIELPQNELYHPEGDVYTHTMLVLDNVSTNISTDTSNVLGIKLAAVCHDMGKLVTTELIDGQVHAYQHELYGEDIAKVFLNRFTDNKKLIDYVCNMTKLHMAPHQTYNNKSRMKKTNKMFDSSLCPKDLILLAYCDSLGKYDEDVGYNPNALEELQWLNDRYNMFVEVMSRPYIKGQDLVNAGLKPGSYFSELMELAHKLRLAGVNKNDSLRQVLATARKFQKQEEMGFLK